MITEEIELYQKQRYYQNILGWLSPILFFLNIFVIVPFLCIYIALVGFEETTDTGHN